MRVESGTCNIGLGINYDLVGRESLRYTTTVVVFGIVVKPLLFSRNVEGKTRERGTRTRIWHMDRSNKG